MTRLCFYCIVLLLLSQVSISQNMRFGIKGGINLCDLYGPDDPVTLDKDYGYNCGFYIDARVGEYLSSIFEIDYSRYKFHFTESIPLVENSILTVKEKNDYFSIPAMLRYKKGHEFVFFYINAGGQLQLLINNSRETTLHINNLLVDSDYYYGYKHNWYDYGFIGGVGIQFKPVNIDLRYYISTRSLYSKNDSREMRYKVLSLEIGFQFNYIDASPYGRKTGWKGIKYKIQHLFK